MTAKIETITLIAPEYVEQIVSSAEKSLKKCWSKLILFQNTTAPKKEQFDALASFQPELFIALFKLESFYNEACKSERDLNSQKTTTGKEFSEETDKLERYKTLLDSIIDIGKSLGDAFAWIFYIHNRHLLKKHYGHEFIPRLPTRVGGQGEIEFIRNCQKFGRYFVLSHSITTFLREGDVSLIDPSGLKVVAIGELKTQKKSDTELTTSIFIIGSRKFPKNMLPKVSGHASPNSNIKQPLDPKFLGRLAKQVEKMKKLFEEPAPNFVPEKLKMTLAYKKIEKLFKETSNDSWNFVKVGRGLLLIGIKSESPTLVYQVKKPPENQSDVYKNGLSQMPLQARKIVDKSLPNNGLLIDSMFYPAKGRYELGLKMRPLFWWPLSAEVREDLIFKRIVIMTIYNPAFLLRALHHAGFDTKFEKENGITISKKCGVKNLKVVGVNYLYELIQANLFSEETIVTLIQKSTENIEKLNVKETTYFNLDFDFIFR